MRSTGELATTLHIFQQVVSTRQVESTTSGNNNKKITSSSSLVPGCVPLSVVLSFWESARGISRIHALLTLALLDEKGVISLVEEDTRNNTGITNNNSGYYQTRTAKRKKKKWESVAAIRSIAAGMEVGTLVPSLREPVAAARHDSFRFEVADLDLGLHDDNGDGDADPTTQPRPPAGGNPSTRLSQKELLLSTNGRNAGSMKSASTTTTTPAREMLQRVRQEMEDVKFGNDVQATDFRFPTELMAHAAISDEGKKFLKTLPVNNVFIQFGKIQLVRQHRKSKVSAGEREPSGGRDNVSSAENVGELRKQHRQLVHMYQHLAKKKLMPSKQSAATRSTIPTDHSEGEPLEGKPDGEEKDQEKHEEEEEKENVLPTDWYLEIPDDGYFYQHIEDHVQLCKNIDCAQADEGAPLVFADDDATAAASSGHRDDSGQLLRITFDWRLHRYLVEHPPQKQRRSTSSASFGATEQDDVEEEEVEEEVDPSVTGEVSISEEASSPKDRQEETADSTVVKEQTHSQQPAAAFDPVAEMFQFFSQRSRVVALAATTAATESSKSHRRTGADGSNNGAAARFVISVSNDNNKMQNVEVGENTTSTSAATQNHDERIHQKAEAPPPQRRKSSVALPPSVVNKIQSFADCCKEIAEEVDGGAGAVEAYTQSVAAGLLSQCLLDMRCAREAVLRFALNPHQDPLKVIHLLAVTRRGMMLRRLDTSSLRFPPAPCQNSTELAAYLVSAASSSLLLHVPTSLAELAALLAHGHPALIDEAAAFHQLVDSVVAPINFELPDLEHYVLPTVEKKTSLLEFFARLYQLDGENLSSTSSIDTYSADSQVKNNVSALAAKILRDDSDESSNVRCLLRATAINSRSAALRLLAEVVLGKKSSKPLQVLQSEWAACVLDDLVGAYWATMEHVRSSQFSVDYPVAIADFVTNKLLPSGISTSGAAVRAAVVDDGPGERLPSCTAAWPVLPEILRDTALRVLSALSHV